MAKITQKQIHAAQAEWRTAIIEIGEVFTNGGDVVGLAKKKIKKLYAYGQKTVDSPVLFKPTKCERRQFRPTFEGALSYFVGHDLAGGDFPEDGGFAIAPWVDVRFANASYIRETDRALAMGNYFFKDTAGGLTKVEYTFGYRLVKVGGSNKLLIELHHSSLPYKA